mgnify:FL=1
MPFPWLGRLGAANAGRSGRRRNRRSQGEVSAPQEDIQVITQRRQRRIGLGIGSVLILTIIGVVLLGYYQEFYRPPRVWAGSVKNVEFTMGDLVARIRVLQGVNRYQGGQVNLSRVPFEYLQNLVNAEILRQRSPVLGIQIHDDDIEDELRRQFLPTADPGEETDPGQLESEFRNSYGGYLTATGLSDADFRVIVEERLAQRALALLLAQEIELIQPHVEVQWIQIPVDGEILIGDVAQRLANEDFTRVAQELNSANQFADPNGYVGWVPKGAFPDLDDYMYGNEEDEIEALKPGSVSGPIFTTDAYYLLKVLAAAEDRELNNTMGQKLLQENVTFWQREALVAGTTAGTVRMNFNSRLYDWVTDQVFITAPRIDRPTPVPDLIPGVPLPGPGP